MPLKSSKELLATYNILDPESRKKHASHEFQAFAYKLAHDLNDLQNLKIYMRLAKNVERSLMERAYSYALDANTENKGRKFMWKLKELRREIQEKLDLQNFDYDFVQKEFKSFRNKLAKVSFSKKNRFDDLFCISDKELPENNKVLVINCSNFRMIEKLTKKGFKVTAVECSRDIKKLAEEQFSFLSSKLRPKFTSINFLKNKFKENSFDYILVNEYWCSIPFESEKKFLNELKRLLKADGIIQLAVKNNEAKQEWKKYKYQDEELKYFMKYNSTKELEEIFKVLGLDVKEKVEYELETLYLLTKNI